MIFTDRKQNLHLIFFSRNANKAHKVSYKIFSSIWQEKTRKSSKVAAAKTPFLQCVCYLCNFLPWAFFIFCDSWKTWFFVKKVYRYSFFHLHVVAFLKTSVLREVRVLNNACTKIPKESCYISYLIKFLINSIFWQCAFILFYFVTISDLPL